MKILLSAYSCEPGKGSERGVGWHVAREVAKYHDVWVLTRPDESKAAIEAEMQRHPVPSLHFVYFTLPFWQDSLRWGQSGAMQLHYYLWQIQAYLVGRKLHRDIGFDLVHHVTFVRYSCPSFLSLLPIPFIWGPVGGGESAPLPFWRDFSFKNKFYEILRWGWRSLGEVDPFTRLTARRSALIFATTHDTAQRIRRLAPSPVKRLSESGISKADITRLSECPPSSSETFRFINIARLLHWKGIYLGLMAFAQAHLPDAEYWILGEGPELKRLQQLAVELGISRQVTFWGMLPRDDVLTKLSQCTVLVHPSLHDSGGWVPLEAMAAGRPVLCLDLGGPSELVTPDVGIRVAAHNPEQATQDMAIAMSKLAQDRDLCCRLGDAGRQKMSRFYSWEAKGKYFADLYREVASGNLDFPDVN